MSAIQIIVAEHVEFDDVRLPTRFWAKAHPDPSTGCWTWTGSKRNGYARIWLNGSMRSAQRWAMQLLGHDITGLVVMHKCDTPPCVNVNHLRLGTVEENVADRDAKFRHAGLRVTHCPRGHAYADFGVRRGRSRFCRECQRLAQVRRYHVNNPTARYYAAK